MSRKYRCVTGIASFDRLTTATAATAAAAATTIAAATHTTATATATATATTRATATIRKFPYEFLPAPQRTNRNLQFHSCVCQI